MKSASVGEATAITTEAAVTAAKVLAAEAVGSALTELPARTLLAESAIGVPKAIALSNGIPLSNAITCITRPKPAGATLTEIAASKVALAETLLNLPSRRALTDISPRPLVSVRNVRVVVTKAAAKAGIVYPSVSVAYAGTVKIVPVDEVVVYENVVASPTGVPSPVVPASTPYCT